VIDQDEATTGLRYYWDTRILKTDKKTFTIKV